eukprot:414081_1
MFHIYTQHNFNDTEFKAKLSSSSSIESNSECAIKYHVNTPLNWTFHGMVTADAFIASKSKLSYSAAILSTSKYIFYPGRDQLKHWIKCTKKPKCVDRSGRQIML